MKDKHFNLVGRILIAVFFLMGGISKFMDPQGTVGYMKAFGIPMAEVLVWVAAAYLVVAAVLLVWGKWTMWVAGSLVLYTLLVTLIFHTSGPEEMVNLLKNLAITGGLLVVVGKGWGSKK